MNLPKPTKLKSGMWRMQASANGKRFSKTFATQEDAMEWALEIRSHVPQYHGTLSLAGAIESYIATKENFLSPSTIDGYRRSMWSLPEWFLRMKLQDIDQLAIQTCVNELAETKSPKYVKNLHSLVCSSIRELRPDVRYNTHLPRNNATEAKIPSIEEIKRLHDAVKGTDLELPFLLAARLGLRSSEICGLTWKSVQGRNLHIFQAYVRGNPGEWVMKSTKTTAGDRTLPMTDDILSLIHKIPKEQERLVQMTGMDIYSRWQKVCKRLGVSYRFHDLRHLNASIMIAEGVPEKYIIDRLGHASHEMIQKVYGHVMKEKRAEINEQVNRSLDKYFPQTSHKVSVKPHYKPFGEFSASVRFPHIPAKKRNSTD